MNFVFSWEEFYENTFDQRNRTDFSDPYKYYISDITSSKGSRFIDFYQSSTTSIKILLESSLFHSNHIGSTSTKDGYSGYGGNIYIRAKLDFVQNKICSYNCSSSQYGQHCYILSQYSTIKYKNYNYLSSYSDLGQSQGYGYSPIHHGNGEVIINNANVSNCRTSQYCGIFIELTNFPGNISQTSFINNSATSYYCILFSGSQPYSYIKSNFLNNKVSDRLFYIYFHDISIIDSIIQNNTATNTFLTYNKVYYLIHSIVDIKGSTSKLNTELSKTDEFEHIFSTTISCECCFSFIINQRTKIKHIKIQITILKCLSSSFFEEAFSEYFTK